jgi:hypothetical protein
MTGQSYEMNAWQYMKLYNTSTEVKNCLLCYATCWDDYIDDCYSKETDRTWIIVNPFDKDNSSYMLSNITNTTVPVEGASSVSGFIFKTDRIITSNSMYEVP